MGVKVPEMTAQSNSPLDVGTWDVEFVKFVSGKSPVKKTPFVQAIFKVVDEDAVNTDGEPYKRQLWADAFKFYLSPNALWRLKKFASEAEVEIPPAGAEYESWSEYAAELTDAFDGLEGTVTTELEDFTDKDDNERQKAVVAEYTF